MKLHVLLLSSTCSFIPFVHGMELDETTREYICYAAWHDNDQQTHHAQHCKEILSKASPIIEHMVDIDGNPIVDIDGNPMAVTIYCASEKSGDLLRWTDYLALTQHHLPNGVVDKQWRILMQQGLFNINLVATDKCPNPGGHNDSHYCALFNSLIRYIYNHENDDTQVYASTRTITMASHSDPAYEDAYDEEFALFSPTILEEMGFKRTLVLDARFDKHVWRYQYDLEHTITSESELDEDEESDSTDSYSLKVHNPHQFDQRLNYRLRHIKNIAMQKIRKILAFINRNNNQQ